MIYTVFPRAATIKPKSFETLAEAKAYGDAEIGENTYTIDEWEDNRSLHPTMTIQELCEYFKANFMTGDPDTVADFIVAGKYPFAFGLPADGKHNRRLVIFLASAYEWLDKMTHSNTYKGDKR